MGSTRKTYSLVLLVVLTLEVYEVKPANILFFHTIASYSHRVATYPLADALAKRGHNVSFLSPFHIKKYHYVNPNITEVVPASLSNTIESFLTADFHISYRLKKLFPRIVYQFYETGKVACEDVFTSPEVIQHFQNHPKLDLIIIDNCMAECAVALAYKYGAKHIFFNTVILLGNEYDSYGFAPESGAIPELEINPPKTPMTLLEKVFNALVSIHFRYEQYKYVQELDALARKHLNVSEDMPFLDDLARNMSLVFYAGDVITDYPRSTPPLIVDVGGLLCENMKIKNLPQEVEDFVSKGDGFIYISLGSLVVSSNLPVEITQVFFDTMEAYPNLRFLWKWEGPFPEKYPNNLYLANWFPQVDLLGHPKIKSFVTQGGRPSTTESLCNGVPMIAFPVLGDQDVNSNRMNKMGANVILELATITHEQLKNAIEKVAFDKGMKDRMIELQKILLDKPISPLNTAVWWTEYVLRHKDTTHLRGATFEQTWWERRLLDVWGFLYSVILIFLVGLGFIFTIVYKFVRHTSVRQLKIKNKNLRKKLK